jgi:hypothetical protein
MSHYNVFTISELVDRVHSYMDRKEHLPVELIEAVLARLFETENETLELHRELYDSEEARQELAIDLSAANDEIDRLKEVSAGIIADRQNAA